jgi:AraC-like DNA-binding protein
MLSNILFFITASFGFLSIAKLFGKNKQQEHSLINKYLIIIIAVNAVRFFLHGIAINYPEIYFTKIVKMVDVISVILMPCFYLYFYNIINENKFESKNLLHFFVPFLLGGIFITNNFIKAINIDLGQKLFFLASILFYLTYAILGFMLLYKNVWYRKAEIKVIQKQNDVIKNWTIFLFICLMMLLLINVLNSLIYKNPIFNNNFLWISSLVWASIFVKLILTPEILYGYNFLNKTIDSEVEKVVLKNVWLLEGTVIPITIEREKILAQKMKPLLLKYLHQIEELSFHSPAFRNPDYSLNDIATALNIPTSHINFIFKYHCNESFSDYKKIVRIHDATKLLENGYLNNHKVELLAIYVGFTSYNTFNIAFKNITGVTTQEYLKRF